jgi:holo-[acyl-carrier protein] synthase
MSDAATGSGVGMDLLEPDRLRVALERRPTLMDRLFTPAEQAYAAGRGAPIQHLAARFCAKEAVFKALGLEIFDPLAIEVVAGGGVVLHGEAARRAQERGVTVMVSLTHVASMAGAVAMVVAREEQGS